jgi:cholesterol oxidase
MTAQHATREPAAPQPRSTRWLSRDIATLVEEQRADPYDVIIVGSGYGGSMAAAEFAGMHTGDGPERRPVSVCVLERGKEYVPGMFPSRFSELPGHVRLHRPGTMKSAGSPEGLFDLRLGDDVSAFVANGLGGGSLVNAGVMEIPRWGTFTHRMPGTAVAALTPQLYEQVKQRLGGEAYEGEPAKFKVMQQAGGSQFRPAVVTIAQQDGPNDQRVQMHKCTQCGDCMTGCNVGAKKSLDTNLLAEAHANGAEIYTGASVLRVTKDNGLWSLEVVFTDHGLRRRHGSFTLLARNVVLAAGALGTPEILMRSKGWRLPLSERLGHQFSCNGDNIAAAHKLDAAAAAGAQEHEPLTQRRVGPTITGVIEEPPRRAAADTADSAPGFLIQEFAVPAPLKRLFDELVTTSEALHALNEGDATAHGNEGAGLDPCAVDPDAMRHSMLLGIIGHDGSTGVLRAPGRKAPADLKTAEGHLGIDWPEAKHSPFLSDSFSRTEARFKSALQPAGRVLPNPMWRLLPERLESLLGRARGPVLTVHPLGGCPVGKDPREGVVDEFGRVFEPAKDPDAPLAFHHGLLVLDASIIPSSLGANPALTIAALAQRAARFNAGEWGWSREAAGTSAAAAPRPLFRLPQECTPPGPARETEVEVIERLSGEVRAAGADYMVELTLRYDPQPLRTLFETMDRSLAVSRRPDPDKPDSRLRIYPMDIWEKMHLEFAGELERDRHAVLVAQLEGRLSFLHRDSSHRFWRVARGLWAWVRNRGLRDTWQSVKSHEIRGDQLGAKVRDSINLASRAGEVRLFEYKLTVGAVHKASAALRDLFNTGSAIEGYKRFTYNRRANPWRQLVELSLTRFPGMLWLSQPVLRVDQRFVAREGLPLAQVVGQQDQAWALGEFASFGMYLARLLLNIHIWTFRKPDAAPPREPQRLPGPHPQLRQAEITEIELAPPHQGVPVVLRLTRYRSEKPQAATLPLLMIHGYSASGSTFAHPAIATCMAEYFSREGRDVWIADLRTSSGMPSALLPWCFEDAALVDIPTAIAHIHKVTGKKVDVFAHCIGAAMLSMALMTDPDDAQQVNEIESGPRRERALARPLEPELLRELLGNLKDRIGKIVLSQKGPALVYTEANALRAYFMRLLRTLILPENYQFASPRNPDIGDQILDRLLASLPYPDSDYDAENPLWPFKTTPWVGFRHRMDALYARDFSSRNIPQRTLAAIGDLFGPLNLDTVSQAIHFVRYNSIASAAGRNLFVTRKRLKERWPANGTLSIHGQENGLADPHTLHVMNVMMTDAQVPGYEPVLFKGMGHQDSLIGKGAPRVFAEIERFLNKRSLT